MKHELKQAEVVGGSVVRIQAAVLALVFALIGGVALFFVTMWLLLKGGTQVGQHLQLLSQYYPGYSVTWTGSIVGFFYGALTGGVLGWAIGFVYNWVLLLRTKTRANSSEA